MVTEEDKKKAEEIKNEGEYIHTYILGGIKEGERWGVGKDRVMGRMGVRGQG